MVDVLTKKQRSYNMSQIKSSKTKPELKLKLLFRRLGFLYQPKIYGRPDFANKKLKVVVFIDGCFWHKCPQHFIAPKSNRKYWITKIKNNAVRDKDVNLFYKASGWKVVRIWEHEIMRRVR
jgi:DNA mismatch endonuclease (patch repair protein)